MTRIPGATYRLQLYRDFPLAEAARLVPYLDSLGITDLYLSPVFQAIPGSRHGYDVINPNLINPELGGPEAFEQLSEEVRRHKMGILLDIVPNHMAASTENPWWHDLIKNGQESRYRDFFDIDWNPPPPLPKNKVLVPILKAPYGECLRNHEIRLIRQDKEEFQIIYEGWKLPVHNSPDMEIDKYNSDILALHRLLEKQSYQLSWWHAAETRINYRRFFDISALIGIRVEDPRVFRETHALLLKLAREGKITGLRIDHIDGLANPAAYLNSLQESLDGYIIVEKILMGDEILRQDWPVSGTTGYDFFAQIAGLFIDSHGLQQLDRFYVQMTRNSLPLREAIYQSRKKVFYELFAGELRSLLTMLGQAVSHDIDARDLYFHEVATAFIEATLRLPVYRTYLESASSFEEDKKTILQALGEARLHLAGEIYLLQDQVWAFLERLLLLQYPEYLRAPQCEDWRRFVLRWQQFTGPLMAKGYEDTALYRYHRLLSLNLIGGNINGEVHSPEEVHAWFGLRQKKSPYTLNATSTHDTKRSEDVNARLNVLSEIPHLWRKHVRFWQKLNQEKKEILGDAPVPDINEEYFIYQNLMGGWPFTSEEVPSFLERFKVYMVKALREAKVHSHWHAPREDYEKNVLGFVDRIFEPLNSENIFLDDFKKFHQRIALCGACNSLSQLVLKMTAPGIPDFYQGCEMWDLSFVDPDNRRPIDFGKRQEALAKNNCEKWISSWRDDGGRIKLHVTQKGLALRRQYPEVFRSGEYIPLPPSGLHRHHVFSFLRKSQDASVLVIIPRLIFPLTKGQFFPMNRIWGDTSIALPSRSPSHWQNFFTQEILPTPAGRGRLLVRDCLRHFPVALLEALDSRYSS